jgi:hypothetical protein
MRKPLFIFILAVSCAFTVCAQGAGADNPQKESNIKIEITIGGKQLTALMTDNATAKDFVSRLPLTVRLDDYANTEKIFYPEPRLTTAGVQGGIAPKAGDICLYVPWGDVCIFYKSGNSNYSSSLIYLARIEGDISALSIPGSLTARFEELR